jgi:hypothetical protein
MKPKLSAIASICVASLFFASVAADDGPAKYTTPEELREAFKEEVGPRTRFSKMPVQDQKRVELASYLDSEDPKLQRETADLLAEGVYHYRYTRWSAFRKYLSDDYPVYVRDIALAYWLVGYLSSEVHETFREERAKALNDLMAEPVSCPHFRAVAIGLRSRWPELVQQEQHVTMIRRLLNLLSHEAAQGDVEGHASDFASMIWSSPATLIEQALPDWYVAETVADARLALMTPAIRSGYLYRQKGQVVKDLLALAAKDSDERIFSAAQKALAKLP